MGDMKLNKKVLGEIEAMADMKHKIDYMINDYSLRDSHSNEVRDFIFMIDNEFRCKMGGLAQDLYSPEDMPA